MHIYIGKLNIIGADNGLSPRRHQAITWTNAGGGGGGGGGMEERGLSTDVETRDRAPFQY